MAQSWDKVAQFWGFKPPSEGEDEAEDTRQEAGADAPASSSNQVTPMANYTGPSVVKGSERVMVTMFLERYDGKMKEVARKFREGEPIILNIEKADKAVAERIIDFTSGLVEGLQGNISKVSNRVLLLTPANVKVSNSSDDSILSIFES